LSLLGHKKVAAKGERRSDFACIVTVYKEAGIAWPLVRSLLAQKYPHFHVYLVADNALGFVMILLLNRAPQEVMKALPTVPLFVMGQIAGLLKIQQANRDFLATSHKEIVEIDDIWEHRQHEFRHLAHLWADEAAS